MMGVGRMVHGTWHMAHGTWHMAKGGVGRSQFSVPGSDGCAHCPCYVLFSAFV